MGRQVLARGLALPLGSLAAATVAINLLALTGPLYALEIYDRVLPARSTASLIAFTTLALGLLAAFAALEYERGRLIIRLSGSAAGHLDERSQTRLRDLAERNVPAHALDAIFTPVYAALLVSLHWTLGVALAASMAALIATATALNRRRGSAEPGSCPPADAMCAAARTTWRVEEANARLAKYDAAQAVSAAVKAVRLFSQSAMLALSAWLAVEGLISAGCIMAISVVTARVLAPIEPVVTHWQPLLQVTKALLTRTSKHLPKIGPVTRHTVMPGEMGLAIDVRSPLDRKETHGTRLSFHLARGDALGIVGASGSGKSRLLAAIAEKTPGLQGALRLDGREVSAFSPSERDRRIGYLPQSPAFRKATLRAILSRFDPAPDADCLLDAARLARIDGFIAELPRAFETEIDPYLLSPGLRQRLALARAVYRTPDVVLLDEPFSHMDAEGDQAVLTAISRLRSQGSIVLAVAHRISALEPVNLVLALKDGRQHLFGPKESALRVVRRDCPPNHRDAS